MKYLRLPLLSPPPFRPKNSRAPFRFSNAPPPSSLSLLSLFSPSPPPSAGLSPDLVVGRTREREERRGRSAVAVQPPVGRRGTRALQIWLIGQTAGKEAAHTRYRAEERGLKARPPAGQRREEKRKTKVGFREALRIGEEKPAAHPILFHPGRRGRRRRGTLKRFIINVKRKKGGDTARYKILFLKKGRREGGGIRAYRKVCVCVWFGRGRGIGLSWAEPSWRSSRTNYRARGGVNFISPHSRSCPTFFGKSLLRFSTPRLMTRGGDSVTLCDPLQHFVKYKGGGEEGDLWEE